MPPKRAGASPSPAVGGRPSSSSRAPSPKARAAAGAAKAKAKAKANASPRAAPNAAPEPPAAVEQPAPPAEPAYEGSPLDLKSADWLLRALSPADMLNLAASATAEEELPARMMLEFVGDKDNSWQTAQASLRQGEQFKQEIFGMDGADFVTKKSLERFGALGQLSPLSLKGKSPAAFAMAVYLEAIIAAAMLKFGLNVEPVMAKPKEPPTWPIKIPFQDLTHAIRDAVEFRRTPLFVCNGHARTVDTFFAYRACSLVDAKWILNAVHIAKEMDANTMREELRKRLVGAIKFGQPIHIAMANSAVKLRQCYCSETQFPESLFNMDLWLQPEQYSKVIREADKEGWPGAFPGRMRADSPSYPFITTDFDLASAREFLPEVLPHFESFAVIEIDPASIN